MGDSPFTFQDLLTPEGQATVRARLMASLAADGQPTASWAPSSVGGVENLMADAVSGGIAFFVAERVAAAVAGRVAALATDSPELGYWQTYLGKRNYKLTKRGATSTVQNVLLTLAPGAPAGKFADGDLWVKAPATGNNYRLSVPAGQTLDVAPGTSEFGTFVAENPGSLYADPAGTVTQLVTARAGLSCVNVRPYDFAPTVVAGTSPGDVEGSFTNPSSTGVGPVPPYAAVRIRIDASGNRGTAKFSDSVDGGLTWRPRGYVPSVHRVPEGGYVFFANATASPSFRAGTIFTLRVADAILQRGADAEGQVAFYRRMSNRWPALSLIPTKGKVDLWAHHASQEVDKVASDADPNTPGGILVTIASSTGPASPAAQVVVEDFIRARLGFKGVKAPASPTVAGAGSPEETVLVTSATRFEVRARGTVYVPAETMAAVQAGADLAWIAEVAQLPLGGDPDALVTREDLFRLLGDLGAEDVQALTLNGVEDDLAVPRGRVAVVADGSSLLADLNWVPT